MSSHLLGFEQLGIEIPNERKKQQKVKCPKCFHTKTKNFKTPDLSINLETGTYCCHRCGWDGRADSDEWIQKQNLGPLFKPAVKKAPEPLPKAYRRPKDRYSPAAGPVREYLLFRGITEKVIDDMAIGQMKDQIAFRFYRKGQLIKVKFRPITERNYIQTRDCEPILYNIDALEGRKSCILTEGEIDALSWKVAGIDQVASLDAGACKPGQDPGLKFACLVAALPIFSKMTKVFLAFDDDEQGNYTAGKAAELIGPEKCYKLTYQEGCKDSNDVLKKYGKRGLKGRIPLAKGFTPELILEYDPIYQNVLKTKYEYKQDLEKPPIIFDVKGKLAVKDIAGFGMMGAIVGHVGAGKTLLSTSIVASHLAKGERKLNFSLNLQGRKLIFLDTEQSGYFFQATQRRAHKMAGVAYGQSPNYEAYHLRNKNERETLLFVDQVIKNTPNLGGLFIDGYVELLEDYNNLRKSKGMVKQMMKWTDLYNLWMAGILHFNPKRNKREIDKIRGHFGTEITNKADWLLAIYEDDGQYKVVNKKNRFPKFTSFDFRRDGNGYPII